MPRTADNKPTPPPEKKPHITRPPQPEKPGRRHQKDLGKRNQPLEEQSGSHNDSLKTLTLYQLSQTAWTKTLPPSLADSMTPCTLKTRPSDHGIPTGPMVLLLYAGPDNHKGLDAAMQIKAVWLTPMVLGIDILRGGKRHDMLTDDLYAHLLQKAQEGELLALAGGPNFRTWSILLHYSQQEGSPGRPLRGRIEPDCWGLRPLSPKDMEKVDADSTLLLQTLYVYHAARKAGTDPLFLEHPEDPEMQSLHPAAKEAASRWITQLMIEFSKEHDIHWVSFPQCALRQMSGAKWTSVAHRDAPKNATLEKLTCTYPPRQPRQQQRRPSEMGPRA